MKAKFKVLRSKGLARALVLALLALGSLGLSLWGMTSSDAFTFTGDIGDLRTAAGAAASGSKASVALSAEAASGSQATSSNKDETISPDSSSSLYAGKIDDNQDAHKNRATDIPGFEGEFEDYHNYLKWNITASKNSVSNGSLKVTDTLLFYYETSKSIPMGMTVVIPEGAVKYTNGMDMVNNVLTSNTFRCYATATPNKGYYTKSISFKGATGGSIAIPGAAGNVFVDSYADTSTTSSNTLYSGKMSIKTKPMGYSGSSNLPNKTISINVGTFSAEFEKLTCDLSFKSNDDKLGTVSDASESIYQLDGPGSTYSVTASVEDGVDAEFLGWYDGDTKITTNAELTRSNMSSYAYSSKTGLWSAKTFTAKFQMIKRDVKYSKTPSTATGTVPATASYLSDASVTTSKKDTFARTDGYWIKGWKVTGDSTGKTLFECVEPGKTFTMPKEAVTVTPVWGKTYTYTVAYYQESLSDGSYAEYSSHHVGMTTEWAGTDLDFSTKHSYTGFTFDPSQGLYKTPDGGLDGNTEFKVYFKRNTYTISFDKNDSGDAEHPASGEIPSITLKYQADFIFDRDVTATFTRKGYDIGNWVKYNEGSSLPESFTPSFKMPANNIIFKPTWTIKRILYQPVHMYQNIDGTWDETRPAVVTVNYFSSVNIASVPKTGFTFDAANSEYSTTSFEWDGDEPKEFKLKYTRNKHDVTFDKGADDAEGSMAAATGKYFDEEYTVPTCGFTRKGYEWDGWEITATGMTKITRTDKPASVSFKIPDADNIVVKALWKPTSLKYSIEYHLMNLDRTTYSVAESETVKDLGVNFDEKVDISSYKITFPGFTSDPSNVYVIDKYQKDDGYVWVLKYTRNNNYTITYNAGTGAGTLSGDMTASNRTGVQFEESVTIADLGYDWDGSYFSTWEVKDATGATVPVKDGKFNMPASNVTITALWVGANVSYTVKHYQEQLDGSYSLIDTEPAKEVKTFTPVEITPKSYPGFTFDKDNSTYKDAEFKIDDFVFELKYKRNKYSLKYAPGCTTGYTGDMSSHNLSAEYFDKTENIATNEYVRPGFKFVKWRVTDSTGADLEGFSGTSFKMPAYNVTVMPEWDGHKVAYTVEHYKMNDDKSTYTKVETEGPTAITIESPIGITPKDYEGYKYNATKSNASVASITKDTTFKLYYDIVSTYKVTFVPGTGVSGKMTNMTGKAYNQSILIPANAYTKPNNAFKGWEVTDAAGNPVTVSGSRFTMPASDVTVKPIWDPDKVGYSVAYQLQSPTSTTTYTNDAIEYYTVASGSNVDLLTDVTPDVKTRYDGYTFKSSNVTSKTGLTAAYKFTLKYDLKATYKVTYDGNGATSGTAPAAITKQKKGVSVTLTTTNPFKKTGYYYTGWKAYDEDGAEVPIKSGKITMPASNVTVKAQWVENNLNYTVKHYQMNLDRTGYTEVTADAEGPITAKAGAAVTITAKTYDGFTFNATKSDYKVTKLIEADHVFKLYYDRNETYTAKFNPGAVSYTGSLANISKLSKDDTITLPENPYTRTVGTYTFKEWKVTSDTDGSTVYTGAPGSTFTMPAANVTITAVWDGVKYKYSVEHYWMNEDRKTYTLHETDPADEEVTAEAPVEAFPKDYEGFKLNTTKTGSTKLANLTKDGYVFKLYYTRVNTYKLTYDKGHDDATGSMTAKSGLSYGQEITLSKNAFKLTGSGFDGWKVFKVSDGTEVPMTDENHFTMPGDDVKVVAQWKLGKVSYYIEYYCMKTDGKTYEKTDEDLIKDHDSDTDIDLTLSPKDVEGFSFNASHASNVVKKSKPIVDGSVFKMYYTRNKYTVKYSEGDAAGHLASGSLAEKSVYYGASVSLPTNPYVRNDEYEFKVWKAYKDDASKDVLLEALTGKFDMPASDVVVEAQWGLKPQYTVEHYLMKTDGTYGTTPDDTSTEPVAVTSYAAVEVDPIDYEGFTFDSAKSDYKDASFIDDGHVFKLYYSRNKYSIKYGPGCTSGYTGDMSAYNKTGVYFDVLETIKPNEYERPGFTFVKWRVLDKDGYDISGVTTENFKMPASNVTIVPEWDGHKVAYTVEHYKMNADKTTYTKVETVGPTAITIEAPISIKPNTYEGYKYNATKSTAKSSAITKDTTFKLYYDLISTYKVTFRAGAGVSGTMTNMTGKTFEQSITIPVNKYTKTGAAFKGWSVKDAAGNPVTVTGSNFKMPASNVIVEPLWEDGKIGYSVTYQLQNLAATAYTTDAIDYFTVDSGVDIDLNASISGLTTKYDGYTFNSANKTTYSAFKSNGYNFTLKYDRNAVYRLTYVAGGPATGTAPAGSSKLKVGQSVTLTTTNPFKWTDHYFTGWKATDSAGAEIAIKSGKITMPASDVTVTAQWIESNITYTVEHYQMNTDRTGYTSAGSEGPFDAKAGAAVTIKAKTYDGFTFNKTKSDYTTTKLAEDGHVFKLYYDRVDTYTATFKPGAKTYTGSLSNITRLSMGDVVTLPDNPYTRDAGFTFIGWKVTNNTDGSSVADSVAAGSTFTMPASNVTVTALWDGPKYKYTVEHYQMNVDRTTYTLKETDPAEEAVAESAVEVSPKTYEGFKFDATKSTTKIANITKDNYVFKLYYTRTTYKIIYKSGNTAATGSMATKTGVNFGDTVTIAKNAFKVPGEGFDGWTVTKESDGSTVTLVDDNHFVMPGDNVIITANWKPGQVSYYIEYYMMATDGKTYKLGDEDFVKDVPAHSDIDLTDAAKGGPVKDIEGFTFDSTNTKNYYEASDFVDDGHVFKLYYKRNKYTVKFSEGDAAGHIKSGSLADKSVYYQASVTLPTNPYVRDDEGYVFQSWAVATVGGTSIADKATGSFKMPADDVECVAKWGLKPLTYYVEHYQENLDGTYTTVKAKETKSCVYFDKKTIEPKTYTGFTYDEAKSLAANGVSSFTDIEMKADKKTYKLYYTRKSGYSITYDKGAATSGDMSSYNRTDCKYGETITIAKNLFEYPGYEFKAWKVTYLDGGSTKTISVSSGKFKIPDVPDMSITITATWDKIKYSYTVTHYMKSTTGSGWEVFKVENFKAYDGVDVSAKVITDNPGLEFLSSEPGNVLSGTVRYNNKVELKVYYDRNQYKIVYRKGDESATGEMDYRTAYYAEVVSLESCGFKKENFISNAWHLTKYNPLVDGEIEDKPAVVDSAKPSLGSTVIETIARPVLKAVGVIDTYITKAPTEIDVVIASDGTFKMPAYDITATSVWSEAGTAKAVYTADATDYMIYVYVMLVSLMLALILVCHKTRRNEK